MKGEIVIMKKIGAFLLILVVMISSLMGCGSSQENSEDKTKEVLATEDTDKTAEDVQSAIESTNGSIKKVAYIPLMTSTDFHLQLAESIVGKLKEAGYEAEYTSPDGDITKQIEIVENYVAQKVDCIVLFPLDGDALSDAVARAQAAGVKVVVMVNATDTYDAALFSDP